MENLPQDNNPDSISVAFPSYVELELELVRGFPKLFKSIRKEILEFIEVTQDLDKNLRVAITENKIYFLKG